ncbi:MAG: hypothetical protein NT138_21465 [Planctomycetales bacterium]|nr:hypothetical protein [Planctomycetales bacterium]
MADSLTDERNGAAGSSQLSRGSASTLSANANVAARSDVEEPLPQTVVIYEPTDEGDEPEMGPVVAALTSASAVSFFSSATFHLLTFLTVAVVAPWLGLDWLLPTEEIQPPLQATLGDEDILGDQASFEFVADISDQFEKPTSSLEQLAAELQRSENGTLLAAQDDVWKSILGSKENDPTEDGSGVLLKVPESGLAVTKGSFTAFTIPANPKPREVYSIVIEVRLPDDVKEFRVSDLVGEVRGSDKYVQKIPYDKDAPYAAGYPVENAGIKVLTSSSVLNVEKNRVQIIVKVPGAARMVKDVIKIRSRKLKEEQELTLVFGVPASSSPNEKSRDE